MKLTFYLFDESVEAPEQAFHPDNLIGDKAYYPVPLREPDNDLWAYLQRDSTNQPDWLPFVLSGCDIDHAERIYNVHNSFVLIIRTRDSEEERFFAFTTGYGFTAINRAKLDVDFGLLVTANSVDAKQLRGVESRTLTEVTRQQHLTMSAGSEFGAFGIDLDRELVGMIAGAPADEDFARQVQGADSLAIHRNIGFREIQELCAELLRRFKSVAYRQHFSFIDRRRRIKKPELKDQLTRKLADAIDAREMEHLTLAFPLQYYDYVDSIVLKTRRGESPIEKLELTELYHALDERGIAHIDLNTSFVIAYDRENHQLKRLPLIQYLVYQTEHDGQAYVLSLGEWFKVDREYVDEVEHQLANMPFESTPDYLPNMQLVRNTKNQVVPEHEGVYNERTGMHVDLVNFDQELFRDRLGRSSIEVCDLFHRSGELICVKKLSGSSEMSHLLHQASVSARLFTSPSRFPTAGLRWPSCQRSGIHHSMLSVRTTQILLMYSQSRAAKIEPCLMISRSLAKLHS